MSRLLPYFLSAGAWIAVALCFSTLLPVFPIFIAFMLVGAWLLPELARRRR